MKRKTIAITSILMAIVILLLCSCKEEEKQKNVSMYDLQKSMVSAGTEMPDMTTVNSSSEDASSLFSYLSDIDYEKVDGFFLAYATEGESFEIAAIRVKETKDVNEALDSLKAHVKNRVNLYKNYQPDQLDRAQHADVFSDGKYAVLIMCDNQKDVKAAFDKAIN